MVEKDKAQILDSRRRHAEQVHDVEQTINQVTCEKDQLKNKFDQVATDWRTALSQLEARHEELEQTMEELQQLNEQLTQSNALLLDLKCQADQAESAAVAADLEKTKFLARMSHEIRSPLSVILGYADQILEDDLDQQQSKEVASQIRGTSDFILEVVNEVLDLSKIEAGAFTLAPSDVDLLTTLQEITQLFEQAVKKQGIELALDMIFPLPSVIVLDGHRFKQVLINLIGNAVKFTEHGAVTVVASFHNGSIQLQVRDSGIGMTQAQLERIFQPFTQAEDTISSRFGGTGLGLYITHQIVEQMDGTLTVTSEAGKGSCFTVLLPIGIETPVLVNAPITPEQPKQPANVMTLKGKVLVAEDTRDLQIIIGAALKKAGLEVVLVSNGQQALDEMAKRNFDLVLLDVEMPILDGVATFKAIRSNENSHKVPVLALTAHAFKDEINRLESVGFDEIITKPFQRQGLYNTLGYWLNRS